MISFQLPLFLLYILNFFLCTNQNPRIAALAIALNQVAIPENKACIQQMERMLKF
ncbi:hypothetical protein Bca4012_021140 [Brassica carinata]